MDSKSSEKRFALIIDADNVSAKYIKPITDELSKYGTITYKRIYGDWTSSLHAKWKDSLLENSITPIQQFSYTTGKNATDSAMIIDAMDIMYTGAVEGFCIVSSDSDFTRLASRIRESGLTVIGMGEKKTPVPFRKACDIFTTLELLVGEGGKASRRGHRGQAASNAGQGSGPSIEQVERAVADIVTDNQNNGKATGLGEVGSRLLKRYPDFDVRSYGTNQLTKLLGEFSSVQITKDGNSVMVELTESSTAPADDRTGDDGRAGTAVPADSENRADDNAAELQDGASEAQESDKPRRSRRSRSRRSRSKASSTGDRAQSFDGESDKAELVLEDKVEIEEVLSSEESVATGRHPHDRADDASHDGAVSVDAAAVGTFDGAQADATSADHSEAGRAFDAADEASVALEDGEERAAQPEAWDSRPARKRRKLSRAQRSEKMHGQTPEQLIFDAVRDAGVDGVGIVDLSKLVRSTFKSFKVRDHGFAQMRQYIASLADIKVEKRGSDYFAVLEE